MKRIEVVLEPHALDLFKEITPQLGITEFGVTQVYRSANIEAAERRLYRGSEYTVELLPRLKLDFIVVEEEVERTVQKLGKLVKFDSVAIVKIDQTIRPAIIQISTARTLESDEAEKDKFDCVGKTTETAKILRPVAIHLTKRISERLGGGFLHLRFFPHR